jgi:hypothetical protein
VNVIGHQAIAQDVHAGFGDIFAEKSEVGVTILAGGEGFAPVDTSLRDVAGNFCATGSGFFAAYVRMNRNRCGI